MEKKAQAWGFDLMVGVSIFFLGMLLFFLYALNLPSERDETFTEMNYEGNLIGDSLLSEGFPSNWNSDNVVNIGILSDGKVNNTKFKEFYDLALVDYNRTRRIFNVENDYYVYFSRPVTVDGVVIHGIGLNDSNPRNVVKVTRVVVHDNEVKNLNINVWN